MKKVGLLIFIAAAVCGIVLAKMFSFGSIPIDLPSISFNSKVKGSGNVAAEKRNVSGFRSVEAGGVFLVEVTAGEEYSVEVEADDNLLQFITTRVDGDTLELETDKRFSTRNRIRVRISAPNIEEIRTGGASHLTLSNVDNDSLTVDTGGASKVTVTGKTGRLNIDMGGASSVNAANLEASAVSIDGGGASKANVKVAEELTVDLGGASRVNYSGNPGHVNKKTSGGASVSQND